MKLIEFNNKNPTIDTSSYIGEGSIIIGDVVVWKNVVITMNAVLRGDMNKIEIDEYSNVQDNCVIHTDFEYGVKVGKRVTIGHTAILHGCTIENDVIIGMGSIVLNNAYIPSNVIIAAGSFVGQNKKLESGFLYAGTPVEKKRELVPNDLEYIKKAYEAYQKLLIIYKKQKNPSS